MFQNGCHTCEVCGYCTNRKSSMIAHKRRKTKCLQNIYIPQHTTNTPCTTHCKDITFRCGSCFKLLSNSYSLRRHANKCCKDKVSLAERLNINVQSVPLAQECTRNGRMHECNLYSRVFASRQALYIHKKRKCKLDRPKGTVSTVYCVNTPSSDISCCFKNYDAETVDHLTYDDWVAIARRFHATACNKGCLMYIEKVLYNEYQPQNHTVRCKNKRSKFLQVWRGGEWVSEEKQLVARVLMEKAANDVDVFLNRNQDKLTESGKTRITPHMMDEVSKMIDDILDRKETVFLRKLRSRVIAFLHDKTKSITVWASRVPFNKTVYLTHELVSDFKETKDGYKERIARDVELSRIRHEIEVHIENEVEMRVAAALRSLQPHLGNIQDLGPPGRH